MAKLGFDGGQVVFGARFETMKQKISGFTQAGTTVTPLVVENDYTDIFPSVNARFDLGDDMVLRGAVQRGIARPSFGAIRTGASINDTRSPRTVSGGNPRLKPEYTWGGDVSFEYYLSSDSVVSIGGFYRGVDNVLYGARTKVTDETYDAGGIDRTGYDFVSTLNGSNGKLYGVELNYQQSFRSLPAPFDGLGVSGNLALLDGQFDTPARKGAPFPGTSKTAVNTAISYEKYGVSARLTYQWRDDWADTLGGLGLGSGGDEFRKACGNLNLTLRYALNSNLTLFADASNLTDETYIAYEGDTNHPLGSGTDRSPVHGRPCASTSDPETIREKASAKRRVLDPAGRRDFPGRDVRPGPDRAGHRPGRERPCSADRRRHELPRSRRLSHRRRPHSQVGPGLSLGPTRQRYAGGLRTA